MTFTIEPMITIGAAATCIWDDGWTAVTADGSRTAQFEHTLLVTDDGVDVLTALGDREPVSEPSASRSELQLEVVVEPGAVGAVRVDAPIRRNPGYRPTRRCRSTERSRSARRTDRCRPVVAECTKLNVPCAPSSDPSNDSIAT